MRVASSIKVSFISVLHFPNGAQSLNTTYVAALLDVAVILPVTKMYASECPKGLTQLTSLKTLFHHFVNNYHQIHCQ